MSYKPKIRTISPAPTKYSNNISHNNLDKKSSSKYLNKNNSNQASANNLS